MEIRNAVHPEHAVLFDTAELREQFLIQNLFKPDEVKLVYSYFDRLIVGGICPVNPLKLAVDEKIIGASSNIGPRNSIESSYNIFDVIYETSGAPAALEQVIRLAASKGKMLSSVLREKTTPYRPIEFSY